MSLNPLLTHNGSQALYAPYTVSGGGGGGGTVSTIAQFYTSSIEASSGSIINVLNRMDVSGAINLTGELNLLSDSLNFSGGPSAYQLQFLANDGAITGVSSINGAVYPPASSQTSVCFQMLPPSGPGATFTITGGTGGTTQSASDPWTSVVGEYYRATITFTYTVSSGTPAADAFIFFNLSGATNESIHIPLANITPNIPMEVSVVGKASAVTTDLEVGLNDSALSVINFALSAVGGVYSMVLEKMGAPQTLT